MIKIGHLLHRAIIMSIVVWCVFLIGNRSSLAQFQSVEFSSSPNPVGSGARAMGMGGAFIGIADDATAASWNPGGLIQLETPEISIVGAYNYRSEDTTYGAFPEASGPQSWDTLELNYLSVAYPFVWLKRNMVVSLNYQHLYDFNKQVSYGFEAIAGPENIHNEMNFEQTGALWTITPAWAIQVTPKFSIGLALNFWNDSLNENGWKSKTTISGVGQIGANDVVTSAVINDENDIEGFNYNVGFLWDISKLITLGTVFKAPFEADTNYHSRFDYTITFPSVPAADQNGTVKSSEKQKLSMPMSYGIGCAIRISDAMTLAIDVYRTDWSEYSLTKENGEKVSPINNKPLDEANVKDTTQVRMGGEYLFIGNRFVIPLRFGLFYDPEPAEENPDSFYGVSVGGGFVYNKFAWDIAYQYRFGMDVKTITVGEEDAFQDVEQHNLYMSLIYYF